jgi:hypothetical protein
VLLIGPGTNFLENSAVLHASPFRPRHWYNINQTASLTTFCLPTSSAGELKIESVDGMSHGTRSCFPSLAWNRQAARPASRAAISN